MFAPFKLSEKLEQLKKPRGEDAADQRLLRAYKELAFKDIEHLQAGDLVIMGYPDDRGIDRNGGRVGACEAPDTIRDYFYRQTLSPLKNREQPIHDLGNFLSWSMDLLTAHEEARKIVAELHQRQVRVVTLGGGHDWAYADFADWTDTVLHLDAHLDMRPNPEDPDRAGHSGTPFRRIFSQNRKLSHLHAVGLQSHCNARAHLEWAGAFPVTTLFLEEMPTNFEDQWKLFLDKTELKKSPGPLALSLDMDVFAQDVSPGVSAPQALGLDPRLVIEIIRVFGPRIKHFGIYEANPRYDRDGATSRLAAKFLHEYLYHC